MSEEKEAEITDEKAEAKKPEWVKMKPSELETLIVELAKQGNSPEKIGLILRDKHGVPKTKAIAEKKISKILKDAKIPIESEKEKIKKKIDILNKHIEKNKHDNTAKRKFVAHLWALKSAEEMQ